MEEEVFRHPAVSRILRDGWVEARLHTDHETLGEKWIEIERAWIGYHSQSTYFALQPKAREVLRWVEFRKEFQSDPPTFARWLEGN
jgi:hypothetical protein